MDNKQQQHNYILLRVFHYQPWVYYIFVIMIIIGFVWSQPMESSQHLQALLVILSQEMEDLLQVLNFLTLLVFMQILQEMCLLLIGVMVE
jgi:hypothetical protein